MQKEEKHIKKDSPFLSIIIPVFNSKAHYKVCLDSLLKMDYPNFEIIIVDDGSTDGSYEDIRKMSLKSPEIKLIQTLKRKGIPASRNIGIEASKGDYIGLLDIDMKLGKGWPKELIKFLLQNNETGGVVPKVLDFHKTDTIQAMGVYLIPHTGWVLPYGYGEKDKGQYDFINEISIGAAGSIVRKDVLMKLGGFDETQGMFDDLDLGWRIRLLGKSTFCVPSAIMYHWTSKAWSKRPKSSSRVELEFYIDNSIRVLIKNLELKSLIRYLPQSLIIMLIRVIVGLIKGNTIPLRGSIKAIIWNTIFLGETLKARKKVQSIRNVSDEALFGKTFVRGNFIEIYFKQLRFVLNRSRMWPEI